MFDRAVASRARGRDARRTRVPLHLLVTLFLCAGSARLLGETSVQFDVQLPDAPRAQALLWGLTQGGIELACGEQRVGDADAGGTRVTFTAALGDRPPQGDAPVLAHLCINRDAWNSYTASFGDTFAIAPVTTGNGGWTARVTPEQWQARTPRDAQTVLTVHYHRFEGDYQDVSLWTWDEHLSRAPADNELAPVGRDDFGLVFQLDVSLYGRPGDRVGLLPRVGRDWGRKDPPDRFWTSTMGSKVYLLQGTGDVTTKRPDTRPRLAGATLDAERTVTARFNRRVPVKDWSADRFQLRREDGRDLQLVSVTPIQPTRGRAAALAIELAEPVDLRREPLTLRTEGGEPVRVRFGRILEDPARFYDADAVMGATWTPEATTFRVFAPTALEVKVVVADAAHGDAGCVEHPMTDEGRGLWAATVRGNLEGRFYAYKLRGSGLEPDREVTDIYATCVQDRHPRSMIVNLAATDPPGFRDSTGPALASPVDAVLYEVHVRDFSIAPDSGMRHKGLYLGFTERGTHLPDNASITTGVEHLLELGVTHVQLLPVQDFDNQETASGYNWGYMPVSFNSPDGWYATRPDGAARIRELKGAIAALHARGIGVVLDVVYNHTSDRAGFERLAPGYYFRMNDAGGFSNGSGCGNEFKSENPMARKFLLDSLAYWVREYRVDGFRFDLMGLTDLETLRQIRTTLERIRPGILLHGEPWAAGPTPLAPISDHAHVRGTGIGAFNDRFRDAIKGDRDGGPPGFIQVGDRVEGIRAGLEGAIRAWASGPLDPVHYFEAHDNLTAWDKLLQSVPDASDRTREQMMRLGALVLLTAQGRPFLHAGQEFCRTKQGNSNSYNAPDAINRIDWTLKQRHAGVFSYYRGLIALRKAHPVLRLRTREEVERRVSFPEAPNKRCVVYRLDGRGLEGESCTEMLVLLNGGSRSAEFVLPPGAWSLLADANRAGVNELSRVEARTNVPPHAGVVLERKEE